MKNGKFTVGIIGLDFGERHLKAAIDNKLEVVGICDMRDGRVYRRDRKWQAHTHHPQRREQRPSQPAWLLSNPQRRVRR